MPDRIRYASPGVRSTASSQSSRNYEALEPKYWEGFFIPGRIFMYQLHERELDDYSKRQRLLVPSASSKTVYRRCVVVRRGRDTSQCLLIKTYEGEGCTRRDIRPMQHHHAAVFTGHEAFRLPEETHLRTPIQAEPISHETVLPRLARLNYDSLFELSHTRPIYPLAQVTPGSLRTLLHDFETLNPPTNIRPFRQTRKRTWDAMLEQLNATSLNPPAPTPRPIRAPIRRAPTFPPRIPEVQAPPKPTAGGPNVEIRAPRPATTPFPTPTARPSIRAPLTLHSSLDARATCPVSALLTTHAELNFIDADLARKLGTTALRYGGPAIVVPGSSGGAVVPAAEGQAKVRWRFEGSERACVDNFVVIRGLPCDVVLGSRTVVERRGGVGREGERALGLPALGRDERKKMEQDDRLKSDQRRRREAVENAEIERGFARRRAEMLRL